MRTYVSAIISLCFLSLPVSAALRHNPFTSAEISTSPHSDDFVSPRRFSGLPLAPERPIAGYSINTEGTHITYFYQDGTDATFVIPPQGFIGGDLACPPPPILPAIPEGHKEFIEVLSSEGTFYEAKHMIAEAESFIHVMLNDFKGDPTSEALVDKLIEKRARGLDVIVLVDPKNFIKHGNNHKGLKLVRKLKKAGVHIYGVQSSRLKNLLSYYLIRRGKIREHLPEGIPVNLLVVDGEVLPTASDAQPAGPALMVPPPLYPYGFIQEPLVVGQSPFYPGYMTTAAIIPPPPLLLFSPPQAPAMPRRLYSLMSTAGFRGDDFASLKADGDYSHKNRLHLSGYFRGPFSQQLEQRIFREFHRKMDQAYSSPYQTPEGRPSGLAQFFQYWGQASKHKFNRLYDRLPKRKKTKARYMQMQEFSQNEIKHEALKPFETTSVLYTSNSIYDRLHQAITSATKEIQINATYLSPLRPIQTALLDAVRRGVKLTILTDSPLIKDTHGGFFKKMAKVFSSKDYSFLDQLRSNPLVDLKYWVSHSPTDWGKKLPQNRSNFMVVDDSLSFIGNFNFDSKSDIHAQHLIEVNNQDLKKKLSDIISYNTRKYSVKP